MFVVGKKNVIFILKRFHQNLLIMKMILSWLQSILKHLI